MDEAMLMQASDGTTETTVLVSMSLLALFLMADASHLLCQRRVHGFDLTLLRR
jgi:hypothetical protein